MNVDFSGLQPPLRIMPHHLLANITQFGRLLRAAGVPVTPQQIADFSEALAHVELSARQDVKNAGRTTLINRREHLALFDQAFDLFWRQPQETRTPAGHPWKQWEERRRLGESQRLALPAAGAQEEDSSQDSEPEFVTMYSAVEILRHKSFAELTPDELAAIKTLLADMTWDLEQRPTRRKTSAPRGPYLDWRRTLRQNLVYGGEPVKLAQRRRKHKRRPLVVICDVSGSMERYSRILLQFIYALSHGLDHVEAFVFGTRLTRVTRQMRRRSLDQALDEIVARAQDMGGGTKIGGALKTFNYRWGRRVLGQGAVVLLISDGWDRGEPDEMQRQMARLQLNTRRLIWLNPLLGSPTYEPLTRGMQAALPFIDHFLPVHNLHSLEQLGALLNALEKGTWDSQGASRRQGSRSTIKLTHPHTP